MISFSRKPLPSPAPATAASPFERIIESRWEGLYNNTRLESTGQVLTQNKAGMVFLAKKPSRLDFLARRKFDRQAKRFRDTLLNAASALGTNAASHASVKRAAEKVVDLIQGTQGPARLVDTTDLRVPLFGLYRAIVLDRADREALDMQRQQAGRGHRLVGYFEHG